MFSYHKSIYHYFESFHVYFRITRDGWVKNCREVPSAYACERYASLFLKIRYFGHIHMYYIFEIIHNDDPSNDKSSK